MEEQFLYHGSRGGIKGTIQPVSRASCDFGIGFYMGENKYQAASLVYDSERPVLYTLRLEIPNETKILKLEEKNWLYVVLANRGRVREFNTLPAAKFWKEYTGKFDLIVGKIADDQMNAAMRRFAQSGMTDRALYACLQKVQYGNQYAAKTEWMCSHIEVMEEIEVNEHTFPGMEDYMQGKFEEAQNVVQEETVRYLREGLYLSEIIAAEKTK